MFDINLWLKDGVVYIIVFRHKFCLLHTHRTVGQSKVSIYYMASAVCLPRCFVQKQICSLGLYISSYRPPPSYFTVCITYEVTTHRLITSWSALSYYIVYNQ